MSRNLLPAVDPQISNPRPRSLSDASHALFTRAIENPTSLTEVERRLVRERPTQEEEDALCRQQTGLTYNEIVEKALSIPDELTFVECHIIERGVEARHLESFDRVQATRELPQDQRTLVESARIAVTEPRELQARAAVGPVFARLKSASATVRDAISMDDRRNLTKAIRIPWLDRILAAGAPDNWGFVLFRCESVDDALWRQYCNTLDQKVHAAFAFKASAARTEPVAKNFTTVHVEDEDAQGTNVEALRQRFAEMRQSVNWVQGLRDDVFLFADAEALRSLEMARPFCWAVEVGQREQDETAKNAGQSLRVALMHVGTLFARLSQKELVGIPSEDEARPWAPYRGPPTLANLLGQAARTEDGIWPPIHHLT